MKEHKTQEPLKNKFIRISLSIIYKLMFVFFVLTFLFLLLGFITTFILLVLNSSEVIDINIFWITFPMWCPCIPCAFVSILLSAFLPLTDKYEILK